MPEPRHATIRELPATAKLTLRGGPDAAGRASGVLGFALPDAMLRAAAGEGGAAEAFRLGPDEWLVLLPPARGDEALSALAGALEGVHHALVPVGERLTGLAVEGPAAADLLNDGCPLDLHERSFPEGMATRTILGRAEIILHRPEDGSGFRLYAGRSFAAYARLYLEEAGREFRAVAAG